MKDCITDENKSLEVGISGRICFLKVWTVSDWLTLRQFGRNLINFKYILDIVIHCEHDADVS